jgi:hypothetical protein
MPPKAKIIRKLRGSVTYIDKRIVIVSFYVKGSDSIIAKLKKSELPKGWKFQKFQVFDYTSVKVEGRSNQAVFHKVKPKHLSKKQIERIRRSVERRLPKDEF